MYSINTFVIVKAPENVVFSVLRNMSEFSKLMYYVKKIKITKVSEKEVNSVWNIDIEGADVNWKEKDIFDDDNLGMAFSLIEGDYSKYSGKWKVTKEGANNTRLSIKIDIDWGVPSFEKVIKKDLQKRTEKIVRGMMIAIKKQAETFEKVKK